MCSNQEGDDIDRILRLRGFAMSHLYSTNAYTTTIDGMSLHAISPRIRKMRGLLDLLTCESVCGKPFYSDFYAGIE